MREIQWFPGHMAKAMKMMGEQVSLVDGIIYVLDARCPASTFNPAIAKIAGNKPILYILNKADLADGRADGLAKLIEGSIKVNSSSSSSRKDILSAVKKLVESKREKALAKGYDKTFRFMVVGVPNTGKSTLINTLAGSARTQTGNKAGVTRGKQWIRLDGFDLLDTPGTMPPACKIRQFALRLAYIGSINDDILDLDDIALALLDELYEKYPDRLKERYGIEDGQNMLDKVCSRRAFILRGGEYDYERAIRAVIDDFRKGRLGRITLDSPQDIALAFNV